MEDLEKPWSIKLKQPDLPQADDDGPTQTAAADSSHWRRATVAWLCKIDLFAPPVLPKMRGGPKAEN